MNSPDLISKFQSSLPVIRKWIDDTLENHKDQAAPINNPDFTRLQQIYPSELLEKTKVVVADKVPFPPFRRIGLPEFAKYEKIPMAGATYKDTFFLNRANQSESIHSHELVHVVQWEVLGVDRFLLAYGAGLMASGYRESPLEKMAYVLQDGFELGSLPANTIDLIRQDTIAIWKGVAPLFGKI